MRTGTSPERKRAGPLNPRPRKHSRIPTRSRMLDRMFVRHSINNHATDPALALRTRIRPRIHARLWKCVRLLFHRHATDPALALRARIRTRSRPRIRPRTRKCVCPRMHVRIHPQKRSRPCRAGHSHILKNVRMSVLMGVSLPNSSGTTKGSRPWGLQAQLPIALTTPSAKPDCAVSGTRRSRRPGGKG